MNYFDDFIKHLIRITGNNNDLVYLILILIVTASIVILPIIVTIIFAFSKEKLSQKSSVLLYAFVCGFFITMALFGFLRESLETSSLYVAKSNKITPLAGLGYNVLIVCGGLLSGLGFAYLVRYLVRLATLKKISKDQEAAVFLHSHDLAHDDDHAHIHHEIAPDHLEFKEKQTPNESHPSYKLVAILLLLIHRIPEGFLIGHFIES
ncbi:UNVERIFIED_CONTAM: hypothetical protein O8I53_12140 [Campylobacter lari]